MNCLIEAWHQHEAELRAFLLRRTGDASLAEDVLQDTFLQALKQGGDFCALGSPRAWLFRVARNRLIDTSRRHRATVAPDENLHLPQTERPAVVSLSHCLPQALSQLAERDREAIVQCDIDGMAQAEFAAMQGLTLSAAKSRVQRARQRLKQTLLTLCGIHFDESGLVCCFDACDC